MRGIVGLVEKVARSLILRKPSYIIGRLIYYPPNIKLIYKYPKVFLYTLSYFNYNL